MTNEKNTPSQAFTEIRLTLFNQDKLRALVTVTAGGVVKISGIRVIEGAKGLFVAMPQKKKEDGSYEDLVHTVNKEVGEELRLYVMGAFQKAVEAKLGAKK